MESVLGFGDSFDGDIDAGDFECVYGGEREGDYGGVGGGSGDYVRGDVCGADLWGVDESCAVVGAGVGFGKSAGVMDLFGGTEFGGMVSDWGLSRGERRKLLWGGSEELRGKIPLEFGESSAIGWESLI